MTVTVSSSFSFGPLDLVARPTVGALDEDRGAEETIGALRLEDEGGGEPERDLDRDVAREDRKVALLEEEVGVAVVLPRLVVRHARDVGIEVDARGLVREE